MKKLQLILLYTLFIFSRGALSQSITFPEDDKGRGYTERPYIRYEAEPGKCETNGTALNSTYDQRLLQSEASNQIAVNLILKNDYIQWTNEAPADGLTIRFSLPDNSNGTGIQGTFALYVNDNFVQNITVNSYWAWQYILKNGSKYPDNTPDATTKFPRMRFDETHVKLNAQIPANATFRLTKVDDNDISYTIDFVELEEVPQPVSYNSITDVNKVMYTADQGTLYSFIAANKGKTIYIPEGVYNVDKRIIITSGDNTKIIGAGMWYTEIYFTASSDDKSTYNQRGIEAYGNNMLLQGIYLNTVNNKRYFQNNDAYQVGKGLMGSFGSNSTIKDVWIEHFECGGWIENANSLTIQHSRFRNNYADGINLSYACKNSTVEQCSFRNNGDDDMASWSRSNGLCENNTFRFCTAENNWRASSLGFFGGKQNKAYNCVIIDPMEAGFRVTCDFPGMPFSSDGYTELHDISVYRGGVASGVVGVSGDLWGNQQGALHLNSSTQYDLQNIIIYNIDLYNSKNDAVFLGSSSKSILNLSLKNIHIYGTGRYGLYFSGTKGNATYCNIEYENIGASSNHNVIPSAFSFTENCESGFQLPSENNLKAFFSGNVLQIIGVENTNVSIFDVLGKKVFNSFVSSPKIYISGLYPGIYMVRWDNFNYTQKVFVPNMI
ncbi:MAG: T9SS type A sorting domain-containing protein [Bacteroidales bacterium]|jgi:hypothetical protein|nr:right-handed parallel beta-helix repeat-containing protein [Paludibacteraceae bacterium]NLJ20656.1 T9SS type A sorting domain-containing protein [Bacteroidales bacterium]